MGKLSGKPLVTPLSLKSSMLFRSQQMEKRNIILRLATEKLSKAANIVLDEAEIQVLDVQYPP